MIQYKVKSRIDKKGNLNLQNLPFKDKDSVEVILLINDYSTLNSTIEERLLKLKNTTGRIKSSVQIPDEELRRENLYGENGR